MIAPLFFIGSSSNLPVSRTDITGTSFNSCLIQLLLSGLLAIECWKNFPYNGENVVDTTAPSFLIGSLSNLQVTRIGIKSRMCLHLGHIWLLNSGLLTLEHMKLHVTKTDFRKFTSWMHAWLQVSVRYPLGRLVVTICRVTLLIKYACYQVRMTRFIFIQDVLKTEVSDLF